MMIPCKLLDKHSIMGNERRTKTEDKLYEIVKMEVIIKSSNQNTQQSLRFLLFKIVISTSHTNTSYQMYLLWSKRRRFILGDQ